MKLQPNYSWQKYQGKPEDQTQQFQYQLQNMFLLISNAVNSTIDDCSYFTRERMTSFTWVDNQPIWTKTLPLSTWVGNTNTIPIGVSGNFTIIEMKGYISSGDLSSSSTIILPNLDFTTPNNRVSIVRTGQDIILTSSGTNYSAFSGYVTIYFIKRK